MRADIYEYTKDKPPHYGLHPPYAAVCFFPRQAGRPDNGNCLDGGEVRGNMRVGISDERRKTLEQFLHFLEKKKDFVPFQIGFRSLAAKYEKYLPI